MSLKELITDGHIAYSRPLTLHCCSLVSCDACPQTRVAAAEEPRARWHKLAKNEVWVDGDQAPGHAQSPVSNRAGSQEEDAAISSSTNEGGSDSSSSSEVTDEACNKQSSSSCPWKCDLDIAEDMVRHKQGLHSMSVHAHPCCSARQIACTTLSMQLDAWLSTSCGHDIYRLPQTTGAGMAGCSRGLCRAGSRQQGGSALSQPGALTQAAEAVPRRSPARACCTWPSLASPAAQLAGACR